MNGTSGFQEVRSSTFCQHRIASEQQHQLGNRSSYLLRTPILHLLIIGAVLTTAFIAFGCAYITHEPMKYYPYPTPPNSASARDEKEKLVKEKKYKEEYQEARNKNYKEDEKQTGGIRYYLSSPYLLVYTDGKGNLVWKIYPLPDQTKLMIASPKQFFAKTTANFTFTNGVLTNSHTEADSSAGLKAMIGALEKVLPFLLLTDDPTGIPAPRLYKIVVDQDNLKLIGVQSKETVSVTLKPGT